MTPRREDGRETPDEILARVQRDAEALPRSNLAHIAKLMTGESVQETPDADKIEIWARRTGRLLGIVFAIFLIVYLIRTFS